MKTLLKEGTPLHKAVGLRSLLEKDGLRLVSAKHLGELIPGIIREEQATINDDEPWAKM